MICKDYGCVIEVKLSHPETTVRRNARHIPPRSAPGAVGEGAKITRDPVIHPGAPVNRHSTHRPDHRKSAGRKFTAQGIANETSGTGDQCFHFGREKNCGTRERIL